MFRSTFIASIITCGALTYGAEYWAEGVTADSGWFDVNKVYGSNLYAVPANDRQMCWAASAANIIQYMQVQKGYPVQYSSTYEESANWSAYKTANQLAIYETFTANFQNLFYTTRDAVAWYTTGQTSFTDSYYANSGYGLSNFLSSSAPGFSSIIQPENTYTAGNAMASCHTFYSDPGFGTFISGTQDYASLFRTALDNSPLALSIFTKSGSGWDTVGHALTMWGFKTDDTGNISSIFVTDSDDEQHFYNPDIPALYRREELLKEVSVTTTEDGLLALDRTTGGFNYDYYLAEMHSFNNLYLAIPEPATASLSLLGLAAMAMRRRRK